MAAKFHEQMGHEIWGVQRGHMILSKCKGHFIVSSILGDAFHVIKDWFEVGMKDRLSSDHLSNSFALKMPRFSYAIYLKGEYARLPNRTL
eukprot:scaffold3023_cov175-Amphora_coffeaeformis.AAC.2